MDNKCETESSQDLNNSSNPSVINPIPEIEIIAIHQESTQEVKDGLHSNDKDEELKDQVQQRRKT